MLNRGSSPELIGALVFALSRTRPSFGYIEVGLPGQKRQGGALSSGKEHFRRGHVFVGGHVVEFEQGVAKLVHVLVGFYQQVLRSFD